MKSTHCLISSVVGGQKSNQWVGSKKVQSPGVGMWSDSTSFSFQSHGCTGVPMRLGCSSKSLFKVSTPPTPRKWATTSEWTVSRRSIPSAFSRSTCLRSWKGSAPRTIFFSGMSVHQGCDTWLWLARLYASERWKMAWSEIFFIQLSLSPWGGSVSSLESALDGKPTILDS